MGLTFNNGRNAAAMTSNSSLNVAIGTSTPSNTYQGLTIYGSNPSLSLQTSSAGGWTWTEYRNSAGTNNFSMGVNQSIPQFVIKAGAGLDSPNFVMTSAGNVGIGISAPTQTFQVYSTASTTSSIFETNSVNSYIALKSTSGINYIGNVSAAMTFEVGGERMRISTAGNVGIGTSSPVYPLVVRVGTNRNWAISASGSGFASLRAGDDGYNNFNRGEIDAIPLLLNSQCGANVLIGTSTDNGGKLQIQGNINVGDRTTANAAYVIFNNNQNGYRFGVNGACTQWEFTNGGLSVVATVNGATGVYTPLSDINKKKDFEDSTIGLNAILGLKPKLFRMKSETNEVEKSLGFIAQEVKEFIPHAYVQEGNFIGFNDRPIIAALVKAIQEQQQQIEELRQIVATK
jgi:hypothetical protein